MNLPKINHIIIAQCQRADGSIEEFELRRIKSNIISIGWHWSDSIFNTFFTLNVLSWTYKW